MVQRDTINATPRENLEKFLSVLQIVDEGIKVLVDSEIVKLGVEASVLEPQEMEGMTEVVDKKKKKKMWSNIRALTKFTPILN